MSQFDVIAGPDAAPVYPSVRKIGAADLKDDLAKGIDDFLAMPSSHVFLGLIYPIAGLCLAGYALPMLFPLMAGFALVGPFAGIGLYEMSRCRELGLDISWEHAFDVVRSHSIFSILSLGLTAQALYVALFGLPPESFTQMITNIFDTPQGWKLIGYGTAIGFVFAVVALSISVVSFPLLLDRDGGVPAAVHTSVRVVWKNPFTMALWGLIVAVVLAIGSLLLFVGRCRSWPSWHLYRKVVEPAAPV